MGVDPRPPAKEARPAAVQFSLEVAKEYWDGVVRWLCIDQKGNTNFGKILQEEVGRWAQCAKARALGRTKSSVDVGTETLATLPSGPKSHDPNRRPLSVGARPDRKSSAISLSLSKKWLNTLNTRRNG